MLNLAVIGGDGIGPEVVGEGLKVLDAVSKQIGFEYTLKEYHAGAASYLDRGGDPNVANIEVMPDEEIEKLKTHDAIYLGAVGHPSVAPGILEKGLLLKLRFALDQYINLRPVKLYPGVKTPLADKTPEDIDCVVIRENTEGLYAGCGGVMRKGTAEEISTQELMTSRFGVERCLRYAFETARRRKAAGYEGKLTLVHKTNVLTFAGGTWFRTFEELGESDYPEIAREYHHVDACTMFLVAKPDCYDVVVTENMFGDIITDLGAAISGGMGMAASANLNPTGETVSMFEPVHGSAPDIAGQNKANPLAAILSLAMLLRETGRLKGEDSLHQAGDIVDAAVMKVTPIAAGDRTGLSTTDIGKMVIDALG